MRGFPKGRHGEVTACEQKCAAYVAQRSAIGDALSTVPSMRLGDVEWEEGGTSHP